MADRKDSMVVSARIPSGLVAKIKAAAKELGVPVSVLLEHMISEWLAN